MAKIFSKFIKELICGDSPLWVIVIICEKKTLSKYIFKTRWSLRRSTRWYIYTIKDNVFVCVSTGRKSVIIYKKQVMYSYVKFRPNINSYIKLNFNKCRDSKKKKKTHYLHFLKSQILIKIKNINITYNAKSIFKI